MGGAELGMLVAEDGGGGCWGISLGLLGPIFSLVSSSGTRPLALWMASICSWRVMLAWAACWVRAMLPEWPSQVTCMEEQKQLVRTPGTEPTCGRRRAGKALGLNGIVPFLLASGSPLPQSSYQWLFLLPQRYQYGVQPTALSCSQCPDLSATERRQREAKPGALLPSQQLSRNAEWRLDPQHRLAVRSNTSLLSHLGRVTREAVSRKTWYLSNPY